jgi:hypothetical protein
MLLCGLTQANNNAVSQVVTGFAIARNVSAFVV